MTPGIRRWLGRASAGALGLLLAVWIAIGWHYSNRILGPDEPPGRTGQDILAVDDSTITLAPTAHARRPGHWGIVWPGGFGRMGAILRSDAERVVRRFERLDGTRPDSTGRLTGFVREADPRNWNGSAFEEVDVPARSGSLPSWLVPGTDSTWAIFVHGRGATRAEVLRHLPYYSALGLPALVISYRNDGSGPLAHGGQYRLGATEWLDLEDAVRWARTHGARDVIVVGCSMGGGIVVQFLRKSSARGEVRAAVLDAPALDWAGIVYGQARQERVPRAVTAWGLWCAGVRSGLRWDDLAQVRHVRELETPILVFHGDADSTVPVAQSRAFAAARPDLVTLREVPGAGHVESANFDSGKYRSTLAAWLRSQGFGGARLHEPRGPGVAVSR